MPPAPMESPVEGYDRVAASGVLASLAFPGLFSRAGAVDAVFLGGRRRVGYRATPLIAAPGSHLTSAQRAHLPPFTHPCRAARLTTRLQRVTCTDSAGLPNVAHAGPSSLGVV